jgi:hypothetical protein
MTKKDGSAWHGFALAIGVPATVAAAISAAPLAIPLGIATYVAMKRGNELEAEAEFERTMEDQRQAAHERVLREPALRAARLVWDEEYEALYRSMENGDITYDEFDKLSDDLMDRYPTDD